MADFLIRNIPLKTLQMAKRLAKKRHHSLQEEILGVLLDVFNVGAGDWSTRADRIRQRLARGGRPFGSSVQLLREDRGR
jgi:hypothetical protein